VRVSHFGEHLGTCARVRARARVCTRVSFAITFAHTLGLNAASILGHEHGAVVIRVELAPMVTAKPETRQPAAH
jgi:hypothetical protein